MFDADLVSNDRVERDDYSPGDYLNQYHIEVEVVESHVEIAFPQFGRPDHSIFVYSRFEIRRKFEQYTKNILVPRNDNRKAQYPVQTIAEIHFSYIFVL